MENDNVNQQENQQQEENQQQQQILFLLTNTLVKWNWEVYLPELLTGLEGWP